MEAQRIREGVKLMQEGDKAASKGLFRKPDWDVASGCYDQAATAFKVAKSYDQAVQAYIKASEALFKADGTHLAGKALENAALIMAQNLNQPQRAAELYQRASNFFMTAGSIDRAAEQLQKAGKVLENTDVNAAIEMYSSACALYEQEDRGRFAIEIFKKAISLLIRSKKYEKALDMLHRQSAVLRKLNNRSHLYKANLSILIICFALGDEVEAGKQFNMMRSEDPGFSQSEEADIGQCLLQAYEQGDQGLLEQTVRRQQVSFLDNEVAKLSRTLTVPGEMLSSGPPPASTSSTTSNYYNPSVPRAPATTNDIHAMSPAQVRAELYGHTPEKPRPSPSPQDPRPTRPSPSENRDLDEAYANLSLSEKSPPSPCQQQPSYPVQEDEDDDEDGLR